MKKLIFLLVLLIAVSPAIVNAQIVESSSFSRTVIQPVKEKKESKWLWCAKAGIGGLFTEGHSHLDYDVMFEGQYRLNDRGFYVGGQIGIMPVADYYDSYSYDESFSHIGAFAGPKIGVNKSFTGGRGIDLSFGIFFHRDFDDYDCMFITPNISAGYWISNIYLGLTYGYAINIDADGSNDNNHLLFNIGYRF